MSVHECGKSPSPYFASVVVDGRRVGDLDADQCLRLDTDIESRISRLEAERLCVRAQFATLRPPLIGEKEAEVRKFSEFAGEELGAELGVAPATAGRQLSFAVAAAERLPDTVAALRAGKIDVRRAQALTEMTAALDQEQTREVERTVLAKGRRPSHSAFRAAIRRRVLTVDPDGADRRHRGARQGRKVIMSPREEGMGQLSALLPAERMLTAYRRIDLLARLAGGPEDKRNLDQRRADVLFDLLMGRDRERVNVEIQVVVPVTSLLRLSDLPGDLPGYGPIPAALARQMAEEPNSTWRRILTDPVEGTPVEVGNQRFPSAALARKVRARDRRCLFPGCATPARQCDLDHVIPHGRPGGRTEEGNLGPQCRRHHRMKHGGRCGKPSRGGPREEGRGPRQHGSGWRLEQTSPGYFVWRSPENRTYHVKPEPYVDDDGPGPAGEI